MDTRKIKEALNRIDELASLQVQDNDNGEAGQLTKDYNLVFDFIDKADKRCQECFEKELE